MLETRGDKLRRIKEMHGDCRLQTTHCPLPTAHCALGMRSRGWVSGWVMVGAASTKGARYTHRAMTCDVF